MEANSCHAVIEGDAIVIRVPFADLSQVVEGAWALGSLDQRWKVTDPAMFGRELAYELDREDEQGTTLVHKMLDAAINETLEQGANGIEEHEDQQDGETDDEE